MHDLERIESLIDPAGRVAGDVRCLRCGYNLRTLPASGACPECGAAVTSSLRGDRLCFSERAWVDSIARGLGVLVVTIAGTVAVTIVDAILFPLSPGGKTRSFSADLTFVMEILARGVLAYAVWVFTRPEPRGLRPSHLLSHRIVLRTLALLQVVTPLSRVGFVVSPRLQQLLMVGINVGCLAFVLGYSLGLAERVPDREGARSARRILAGIAGAVLLTLFGGFAEWMWPQRFASMTFVSFGLGLFVALSFPIIMMLGRFQRVLARVAETMSIAETGSS